MIRPSHADLVLSQALLSLAIHSAELSSIVKSSQPSNKTRELDYDVLAYDPGKVIVAKKEGYCHVNYRGSSMTWIDWDAQDFGREKICFRQEPLKQQQQQDQLLEEQEDDQQQDHANETSSSSSSSSSSSICCSTRIGFAKAYKATSRKKIEKAIRECAKDCINPDECVVFGGHSEGGAVAAIAALDMADLNPYIITFGQPSTIDTPCPMLSAERFLRFVNTQEESNHDVDGRGGSGGGITYDPVPFIQGLGADNFGYMILVGQDSQRVASVGLATRTVDVHPNIPFGLQAHSMVKNHAIPGYLDRLVNLKTNHQGSFPIPTNGFENGAMCNDAMECQSGKCHLDNHGNNHNNKNHSWTTCVSVECTNPGQCRPSENCFNGQCVAKLSSCMPCQNDLDCASNKCLWNLCTGLSNTGGGSGLLDNNCNCKMDIDCASHRCRFGVCEAKLPLGAICVASEDCSSGACVSVPTTTTTTTAITTAESSATNIVSSSSMAHCMDPSKVGIWMPEEWSDATSSTAVSSSLTWTRMSWASLLVVMLCCTILTFTIVKRFLHCGRKDYSMIPNATTRYYA